MNGNNQDWFPTVSGFDIEAPIGRGGFATVYRARQPHLNRVVALKILDVRRDDPDAARRFQTEAAAIGALTGHPTVVTVFETGITAQGDAYLAMEYLPDGSLQSRVVRLGPLAWPEVAAVGAAVADALAAAHRIGILHRDVKPANILCDRFGGFKLSDFGIASLVSAGDVTTNAVPATVAYSSPEVLEGERATVASDLYSLGASLYALSNGRPAFVRPSDESILPVMRRITNEIVPPLGEDVGPAWLRHAIETLMSRDPADRPADAITAIALLKDPSKADHRGVSLAKPELYSPNVPDADIDGDEITLLRTSLSLLSSSPATDAPASETSSTAQTAAPQVEALAPIRRSRRTPVMITAAVAATLTFGVIGFLVLAPTVRRTPHGSGRSRSLSTALTSNRTTPTGPRHFKGQALIKVGSHPFGLAAGYGSIWVANEGDGTVTRVEVTSSGAHIRDTIPVGPSPYNIACCENGVWVANNGGDTVTRIDPTTDRAKNVTVGPGPYAIATGGGSVWVASNTDSTVVRINPATNAVSRPVHVGADPEGGMVVTASGVWLTGFGSNTVTEINPATKSVARLIPVSAGPTAIGASGSSVWIVQLGAKKVARISTISGAVTPGGSIGGSAQGLAVGLHAIWVTSANDDGLWKFDPNTGRLLIGSHFEANSQPIGVVTAYGSVWVALFKSGQLARVAG